MREFMMELDRGTLPAQRVKQHMETWRTEDVDLIIFLRETVEDDLLPPGTMGPHFGISRVKVLETLIRTGDDAAIDWAIARIGRELLEPLRTRNDEYYRVGLLNALGMATNNEALDFLLRVQSKNLWSGAEAPKVDMESLHAGKITSEEENARAIMHLRTSAINAIGATGTKRAVDILGTGKGIAPDLQGMRDMAFRIAVRRHVGVHDYPESHGEELPEDKLSAINRIYAEYEKIYEPYEVRDIWEDIAETPL